MHMHTRARAHTHTHTHTHTNVQDSSSRGHIMIICLIISNAPNLSDTCVRLKALYIKRYSNTQPNLIMHYIAHSIPHFLLRAYAHTHIHTHTHTHARTHARTHACATPRLPLFPSLPTPNPRLITSQSVKM